jgi:serine/threonine protein kinase
MYLAREGNSLFFYYFDYIVLIISRFAKCFEFIHLKTFECLAGKVISKSSLIKPRTRQKLLSEIKIHNSLNHSNIVKFIHCFEDKTNVYLILELCKNKVYLSFLFTLLSISLLLNFFESGVDLLNLKRISSCLKSFLQFFIFIIIISYIETSN